MSLESARNDAGDGGQARAGAEAPDLVAARRILALLREDDLDAAIEAGLARFQPLPGLGNAENQALAGARDRLLAAWAARGRYRAREARLQRIADERRRAREARMPAATDGIAGPASPATSAATNAPDQAACGADARPRPTLPPAAAAALARARARAAGRTP